ncbi:arylamine N-acetyltransferase family protein [Sphingomonas crusticola]|uniref:arylamine N-acetyltransferase family protein n=1 Tax=Sphingomonas crusticola TaxID=1697973 RepID=UPI001F077455|nr:arylamine N-acetyltransferase [Sphingomonas crusticola]
MPFDLSAYLARTGLAVAPPPTAEGLALLQRAHRLTIPFENLDVILGRGIAIDSDSVFAKLVTARRGGYCFEQNRLFGDALDALGFVARPLLARVWLGIQGPPPPKTHTLSLVTIDGQCWIADAGFGGSYAPPMPLAEGETADAPDGARFRLMRDPLHGWMLERDGDPATTDGRGGGTGWQPQYSFSLDPVFTNDLILSNHWTSTAPDSRFRNVRIASIVLPQGFASLTDAAYRRRNGDKEASGEIGDPRVYRMRLSLLFGIDLAAEDVAALGLFPAA